MAKPPAKTAKSKEAKAAKTEESAAIRGPRKLKTPEYKSFRLQRRIKPHMHKLPSAWRLFIGSLSILGKNWKLFGGIVLVYGILNVLLVQGFTNGSDLGEMKGLVDEIFTGRMGELLTGMTLFAYLLGTAGNTSSDVAGAYQMVLAVLVSLVLIWTLRQVYAGKKVRVRDGFYQGIYPLVPFILVLVVLLLQLIPALIGAFLYSTVTSGGIAIHALERLLWTVMLLLSILLSVYMMCSSLFALYVAALPNTAPMQALRAARELVRYRRWTVLRKVIFLPIALMLLAAIIMVPLILFATPVASWAFFLMTMTGLVIIHSYLYRLYRELLQ